VQLIDVRDADGAFRCLFLRRIQRHTLRTPLTAPDLLLGPRVCLIVLPVSPLLIAVCPYQLRSIARMVRILTHHMASDTDN